MRSALIGRLQLSAPPLGSQGEEREGPFSQEAEAQVMEEGVLGKEKQSTLRGADQVLSPALPHKPQKTGSGTVVLCPLTKLL